MRVLSFLVDNRAGFGIAVDGGIVDAGRRLNAQGDLLALMQAGKLESLHDLVDTAPDYSLKDVRFLPVIPNPAAKFLCIGINYVPHMREMGRDAPEHPVVFVRFVSSLVGHAEPMIRPAVSEKYDFEGELAVIIGKRARNVQQANALEFVAGYSCFNDGSVRDFQRHSSQFTAGKNFVGSGAFGPWMVTADELSDPNSLRLETRLNGSAVQSESTGELLFGIPALIEYISMWTELMPGDVIVTGTPGGVGAGRTPPLWMKHGDTIEVEISGIGCLSNAIRDSDAA